MEMKKEEQGIAIKVRNTTVVLSMDEARALYHKLHGVFNPPRTATLDTLVVNNDGKS